jgi:hypothetical protein
MLDKLNLDEYFYDEGKSQPKYKLEFKDLKIQNERMKGFKRDDKYIYESEEYKLIDDVEDNDFTPSINLVINSKVRSCRYW